jgi:hypothetical protein
VPSATPVHFPRPKGVVARCAHGSQKPADVPDVGRGARGVRPEGRRRPADLHRRVAGERPPVLVLGVVVTALLTVLMFDVHVLFGARAGAVTTPVLAVAVLDSSSAAIVPCGLDESARLPPARRPGRAALPRCGRRDGRLAGRVLHLRTGVGVGSAAAPWRVRHARAGDQLGRDRAGVLRERQHGAGAGDSGRAAEIPGRIPAGQGVAGDLQGAAVFLASRAAGYVHGAVLTVDEGG